MNPLFTVPTHVCAEILAGMNRSNFTVRMLPTGHGLLVNSTGLNADDTRSAEHRTLCRPSLIG